MRGLYLVVGFFFSAGILAGVWGASGLETTRVDELHEYIDHLFINADHLEANAKEQFIMVTYNNVMLIAAIYIAGLSVIGIPVMLGLLFVRGFAIGFAVWFVLNEIGWPGVLLILASILPQNLILIPAILFAAAVAISFSLLLIRRGFNPEIQVWSSFLRYSGMLAAAAAVAVGAGLVEAFIVPSILKILFAFPG